MQLFDHPDARFLTTFTVVIAYSGCAGRKSCVNQHINVITMDFLLAVKFRASPARGVENDHFIIFVGSTPSRPITFLSKYVGKNATMCIRIGYQDLPSASGRIQRSGFTEFNIVSTVFGRYRASSAI